MSAIVLTNWSVNVDPENVVRLCGIVYGHHTIEDGLSITTSRVHRLAYGKNMTLYVQTNNTEYALPAGKDSYKLVGLMATRQKGM